MRFTWIGAVCLTVLSLAPAQTTKPAVAGAQAAMEQFLLAMTKGQVAAAAKRVITDRKPEALERRLAGMSKDLTSGEFEIALLETRENSDVAIVLLKRIDKRDAQNPPRYTPMPLSRKDGQWFVLMGDEKMLTEKQQTQFRDLADWANARLLVLTGASTRSTTSPTQ